MGETAYVVQVQRVGKTLIVDVGGVILGVLRRQFQVVHWIGMGQTGGQVVRAPSRFQSEVKLGCAQLHIVFPNIFGVAVEGRNGQQAVTAGTGIHRGSRVGKR